MIQGKYLNIIKTVCIKAIANIKINREKLNKFQLKPVNRQCCLLSPIQYSTWVRQLIKIKRIQTGQTDIKVSSFADDMIYT